MPERLLSEAEFVKRLGSHPELRSRMESLLLACPSGNQHPNHCGNRRRPNIIIESAETARPTIVLERNNRERPTNAMTPHPVNDEAARLATGKENYWREVYNPPPECRQVRTVLKDLECRNQEENIRQQFERQWANKLASGWLPRELK